MIPIPNYSDFYKFITSFGLFLMIGSIIIYLLVMNSSINTIQDFALQYTPEEMSKQGYSNSTIEIIQKTYGSRMQLNSLLIKII
ncbi:unnamed protein product, partial [marine sediment metagenome]